MKKYISYIMVALLLVSCSDIENYLDGSGDGSRLSLSSVDNILSEARSRAVIDADSFNVQANLGLFLTGTGYYSGSGTSADYANVKYSNTSGILNYWSSTSPIPLSTASGTLYAYYPYSTTDMTYPNLAVSASLNGTDYMYAVPKTGVSSSIKEDGTRYGTVRLTMRHALACVVLKISKGTYSKTPTLSNVKLSGDNIGTAGKLNITTGVLTKDGTASMVKADCSLAISPAADVSTEMTYNCLVVPADTTNAKEVSLTCTINSIAMAVSLGQMTLKQGNKYIVTVVVDDTGLKVKSVTLTDWNTLTSSVNEMGTTHDYVEIGGLLWSTKNLGATTVAESPETCYGDYFTFGGTSSWVESVEWDKLTAYGTDVTATFISAKPGGYITDNDPLTNTKYTTASLDRSLDDSDDAVVQIWGGDWRTPSSNEFLALYNACGGAIKTYTGTTITEQGIYNIVPAIGGSVTLDGETYKVPGMLFVAKDVSKRVFFPATGYMYDVLKLAGYEAWYASSSAFDGSHEYAFFINSRTTGGPNITVQNSNAGRYFGFPIRPVMSPKIQGHEYVTIGGLKWATMNIGATTVATSKNTSYGDYFAWGETEPYYTSVERETQLGVGTYNNKVTGNGFYSRKTTYGSWTEYCGTTSFTEWPDAPYDDSGVLKPEYDAATANWGSYWRMPTLSEFQKLVETCGGNNPTGTTTNINTTTWTAAAPTVPTAKGIYYHSDASYGGYNVPGILFCDGSGHSIFLPKAGWIVYTASADENINCLCDYWTSTHVDGGSQAQFFFVNMANTDMHVQGFNRFQGFTIRAVSDQ